MGLHLPEDRRPHESTYASLKPYYQTDEDGVSKYHKIMAAAGYYVHPSKLNPRANPFTSGSPSGAASQQQAGGHRPVESAAGVDHPSSLAAQQEGATATSLSSQAAAAEQAGMAGGPLNPNAAPYYPPVGSNPGPSSYPLGSLYQQQQAGRQGFQNPSQGFPNPVSQRTGQQAGVVSSSANPAGVLGQPAHQSGEFANPNAQMSPDLQQGQLYMGSEGREGPQPRAVGGHRQHLAEKLHLPMDWHMDVLAGKAPATFSPLGDQATSGYFPPVLNFDSAMHTSEDMAGVTQPQRLSPDPKRYAQHALRVSAQALGHVPYSQGGQFPPPQQLTQAQTQPPQDYQAAGNPGSPYPSYGGSGYANPGQNPAMGGHRPQSPSVVVYPGQNPGMTTYLSHHPNQGSGYVQQHPGYPTQAGVYPAQGGGYPSLSPARPNQGSGYPSQRPGYPYQGTGFTITPLHPPGQAANPSQGAWGAAYPHQSPHHVASYPLQTPGLAAYSPQSPGGPGSYPAQGGIQAFYPGQNYNPAMSANPSQSSLFGCQQGQSMGAGAYPSQSGLFTSQQGQSMAGAPGYFSQSGLFTSQQGESMGGVPAYPTQQPATAAYPSQAGVSHPQHGQGSGPAGGGALGGFNPDSFLGSNGKPMISGTLCLLVRRRRSVSQPTPRLITCANHSSDVRCFIRHRPGCPQTSLLCKHRSLSGNAVCLCGQPWSVHGHLSFGGSWKLSLCIVHQAVAWTVQLTCACCDI